MIKTVGLHVDCELICVNIPNFKLIEAKNKGVVCSSHREKVQVLISFF